MGNSSSRDDEMNFALPSQQVVSVGGGPAALSAAAMAAGQRGRVPDALARQAVAAMPRRSTQEVKAPLVWDKSALQLQRASGRHRWELSATFKADVPCELQVCFHCRCHTDSGTASYEAVDSDAPPGFTKAYPAGRHDLSVGPIDLHRWPLEVFWRYRARDPSVIPIVLSLTAQGRSQAIMHLSLEPPNRWRTSGQEAPLEWKVLVQKVFLDGQEYTLEEIFGLAEMGKDSAHDESAHGTPCVICLCEPRTTAVLPCRHLCVCEDCGGQLQAVQAQRKCPICRRKIEGLQIIHVTGKSS